MENSLFSARLYRDNPDRTAIIGNGSSCTYGDMHKGILGLSQKLREMGVEKGTKVALWGYNSANWLIAFFAIARAGGIALLVNYSLSCDDAAVLLRMTDTTFLLCGDNGSTKKNPNTMSELASLVGIPESHCLDIRSASMRILRKRFAMRPCRMCRIVPTRRVPLWSSLPPVPLPGRKRCRSPRRH
ncbi:MAG: acyl--CoA ligase [Clostridia bacterium]|nr:acyl--CoA ligase [Clostridia bacterium]